MKLDDLLGLGKILPVDKLIDLLSRSVGAISKPYFEKRDIDTKAYEIRTLAAAKADAMKTLASGIKETAAGTSGIDYSEGGITISSHKQTREQYVSELACPDLETRTCQRIGFQEAKKQLNIETVAAIAADELKNEPPITDEPVDETWTTRFFNYASEVSDEEMQTIWGRILAGEVKQPKTYSLRTLETLRNLSKHEAEIFIKVSNLAIRSESGYLIFKGNGEKDFSENVGLSYLDMAALKEIGIVHESDITHYKIKKNKFPAKTHFLIGNYIIFVERTPSLVEKNIPVRLFTQVGFQLLTLVKPHPSIDYINAFAESLKDDTTTVEYAFILKHEGEDIEYSETLSNFPISEAE